MSKILQFHVVFHIKEYKAATHGTHFQLMKLALGR